MSAVVASPTLGVESLDPVRALQHALYRAAKADPGRRFHALYDKVHRRDVLARAWWLVRRNSGAPGIDHITIADVEEYGVARLLDELAAELQAGRFRPLPARRVFIPKPGSAEQRPLSIPAIRDRVVQAAVKIVIEPIFEADFLPCSFGFRPKRSAHDALQVLIDESFKGKRWVVETDVANCFEAIPHSGLMSAVQERVSDRRLLGLLRAFLRAGVMHEGTVRRAVTGTPQGGVVSPLLANVYLHRLDRAWRGAYGTPVRYADLCGAPHKSAYVGHRIMPRVDREPLWGRVSGRFARHNPAGPGDVHRLSRKARTASGGWYRPWGVSSGVTRSRAACLRVRSAFTGGVGYCNCPNASQWRAVTSGLMGWAVGRWRRL